VRYIYYTTTRFPGSPLGSSSKASQYYSSVKVIKIMAKLGLHAARQIQRSCCVCRFALTVMLLWIPSDSNQHHGDDDEKSTKVQRQARIRAVRTTLACVCSSLMVLLVMILQLRLYNSENNAYEPNLRRREQLRRIPYNSIYRLSVSDAQGQSTSLERFFGKVTLVVNTACL
jgi:hypothetical protein